MKNSQRQRIETMEKKFNEVSKALRNLENALEDWEEKMPLFNKLIKYYMGEEWRKDFEASNQEDFPSPEEMSHGILAEDTIFNEITEHRELAIRLLKVGTKMLEM